MALRAGLTGGIGCGKTTVACIFLQLGVPVIDADQISRNLTQGTQGSVLSKIRTQFGDIAFKEDNSLDRAYMRDLVFKSLQAKQKLEAILHPLIQDEIHHQFNLLASSSEIIILDIPLLSQHHMWYQLLDKILVIDCSEETQIQRVMNRSGWSKKQTLAAIAAQASRKERLSIATDVIFNDQISLDTLFVQVKAILQKWRKSLTPSIQELP